MTVFCQTQMRSLFSSNMSCWILGFSFIRCRFMMLYFKNIFLLCVADIFMCGKCVWEINQFVIDYDVLDLTNLHIISRFVQNWSRAYKYSPYSRTHAPVSLKVRPKRNFKQFLLPTVLRFLKFISNIRITKLRKTKH